MARSPVGSHLGSLIIADDHIAADDVYGFVCRGGSRGCGGKTSRMRARCCLHWRVASTTRPGSRHLLEGHTPSEAFHLHRRAHTAGAHEWRTKGIELAAIGGRSHPHYGVFAPIRHDLVATAPLPPPRRQRGRCRSAACGLSGRCGMRTGGADGTRTRDPRRDRPVF